MAVFVPEVKQKAQLEHAATRWLPRIRARDFSRKAATNVDGFIGERIKIARYEAAKSNGLPAYFHNGQLKRQRCRHGEMCRSK
jgi:hypothetical protein